MKENTRSLSQCYTANTWQRWYQNARSIFVLSPHGIWSCLSHSDVSAICIMLPPTSTQHQWLTKYGERIFVVSRRETFEEEGLPISTETQQRLPTLATHKVVFSNREGKCAQSTIQCGNDPVGFLEAHILYWGSTAWMLLVVVSSWCWSTTSWLSLKFNLPF